MTSTELARHYHRRPELGIWPTEGNALIPIRDLTDEHLSNIITMLQSREPRNMTPEWLAVLTSERKRRKLCTMTSST